MVVSSNVATSVDAGKAAPTESKHNVNFKVANGVYYMKEVNAENAWPTTSIDGQTITWKSSKTYVVLVGSTALNVSSPADEWKDVLVGITAADVAARTGSGTDDGIMNESVAERRVILKKVGENNVALDGARFRIFRSDLSEVAGADYVAAGYATGASAFVSDSNTGVYFVGDLPLGTYYLVETGAPTAVGHSSNEGKVFELDV